MTTAAHEKVAILLEMLGEGTAEQVIASLPSDSAADVRAAIEKMQTTGKTRRQKEQAVLEFDRFFRFARKVGGRRLRVVSDASDEEDTESSGARVWHPFDPGDDPLEDLNKLSPQQLSTCLAQEHPRTAALMLRNLPGSSSAAVLDLMPDEHRQKVFVELSGPLNMDPELVERIAHAVVRKAVTFDPEPAEDPDPIQMAADVLRSVDRRQRRPLLEALETNNQETAVELLDRLYVFEDILELDSRNLQRLLGEVDSQMLATALCGAAPELVDKVLSNLAKRARAALREEMEFHEHTSAGIIEQARKSIAGILAQLDQDEA